MIYLLRDRMIFFSNTNSYSELKDAEERLDKYVKEKDLGMSVCENAGEIGVPAWYAPTDVSLEDFMSVIPTAQVILDIEDFTIKPYEHSMSAKEKDVLHKEVVDMVLRIPELERLIAEEKSASKFKVKELEGRLKALNTENTEAAQSVRTGTEKRFEPVTLKKDFDKKVNRYYSLLTGKEIIDLRTNMTDVELQRAIDDKVHEEEDDSENEGKITDNLNEFISESEDNEGTEYGEKSDVEQEESESPDAEFIM